MTNSLRTGILAGVAALALTGATAAMAQTTTAPSGTDCSASSAAGTSACQNQLQQPGMINNNLQTPITPQTNSPAVGTEGGSSGSIGGSSSGGVGVGGSGGSAGGGGGGVGGSSSGGASSN